MVNLHRYHARICFVANAILIHEKKVLLVKHKKLGIWLAPGGHVEPGELPHKAAERECYEETGIAVKAVGLQPLIDSQTVQYFPAPILSNLHWVAKENYDIRIQSQKPEHPMITKKWPRGCEQHLGFLYLVKPTGSIDCHYDPNESTDIGWFSEAEIIDLDIMAHIRQEINIAFKVASSVKT